MKNLFQTICYLALMNSHGEGFRHCSPLYIIEKRALLNDSEADAFSRLDMTNQSLVISYCQKWDVEIPATVMEYIKALKEEFLK